MDQNNLQNVMNALLQTLSHVENDRVQAELLLAQVFLRFLFG